MTFTLHHGDCLEIMAGMDAGSVDAVVTDPPFFAPATHYQSRLDWQRRWSDMSVLQQWWAGICDPMARVLKPTGHMLTFCNADSYPAFYPPMYSRWSKLVCLVWDKERPGLGRVWRHQHELIIAARNKGAWEPNDGRLRGDVVRQKATLPRDREHPVEKPEQLLRQLIEACCPVGGVVFDPFMGSGTTGEAALLCGRKFVGIELDEHYFEIARRRIDAATAQTRMEMPA